MGVKRYSFYVLTMRNAERIAAVEKQMATLSLDFQYVDAVVLNDNDREEFPVDYDFIYKKYGKPITSGEVGCFLSHRKIWKDVVDKQKNSVVFEDDALIDNKLMNFLTVLPDHSIEFDVILLGHSKKDYHRKKLYHFLEPLKTSLSIGEFYLGRGFKTWPSGAVGYVITPKGAQKLLDETSVVRSVLDDWPFYEMSGVVVKEVRPLLVWEDYINLESSLEGDRKTASRKSIYFLARVLRGVIRNAIAKPGAKP